MATTTPDNLRTPNPGDPYNLVADLATFAGDVQTALNTRANTYKGTTAQRTAALSTTPVGALWQDTNGTGMIWKRGATAWEPAVWRWAGTTAQMNAFTAAPDGFKWVSTTDNSEYVRTGGVWAPPYPTAETARGIWVDGKTLYQRSFTGGITQSAGVRNMRTLLTGADAVVKVDGYFTGSDGTKYVVPSTSGNDALSTAFHFSYIYTNSGGTVTMVTRSDGARSNAPFAVSVWYTKP